MVRFHFFGIPVSVHPLFWLIAFLLGRGFSLQSTADLIGVGLWMFAMFISILVHELGHIWMGLKLGEKDPEIRLWGGGGLAIFHNPGRRTRIQQIAISLAGPGLQFGLGFLLTLLPLIFFSVTKPDAFSAAYQAYGDKPDLLLSLSLNQLVGDNYLIKEAYSSLILISIVWAFFNLIPVLPLDGGRVMASLLGNNKIKQAYQLSAVFAVAIAILSLLLLHNFILSIFLLFFAYTNWKNSQNL